MTNINYTQFAITDAEFVLRLIKNGEWDRALDRAELLMDSIKGAAAS